ncbi:enoyl-CoA hydratase/isomeras-like protein [Leptodontidium sp. MPI-SDFR-AT-0119]|nr:enoyl-CoA hydratase/isomeras-like protein [Leptodontidium sp. MPI-SDFR-AT-0119]
MSFSWIRLSAISLVISTIAGLDLPVYPGLRTNQSRPGVLEVAFNNPPVNVWGLDAVAGLTDIVQRLRNDTETKVVLFTSDVPRFFVNHLDLLITPFDPTIAHRTAELLFNLSSLNQITIAAVEGKCRGAGNEFLTSLDMRFATTTHTLMGQPEIGLGLIPGAGGSNFLPRLIGRGRGMEYVLSGKDIGATEAAEIGWINKAFETTQAMNGHIDDLLSRFVLFSLPAIGLAKQSVNAATRPTLSELTADADRFLQTLNNPDVPVLIGKALALAQNQTDTVAENFFGETIPLLYA